MNHLRLRPENLPNAVVDNRQNEYDVFYFTFQSSARQGGTVNQPQFSLGLAGLLGNTDIYDQNHIYIIPTFFTGTIYNSLLSDALSDYYEVRATPFQSQNENNKTSHPFVILRGNGEQVIKNSNKTYTHYDYNTYGRENNKGLRLPLGVLNFDTITLSANTISGTVINFNDDANTTNDQPDYLKDFVLQFKIVCYKR